MIPPSQLPSVEALVSAAVVVALAVFADRVLVIAVDRAVSRKAARGMDATYESFVTRVRVLRRLGRVAIAVVAAAAVLSHFPFLRALSTGLWASAGVAGLVVGMAAKGTLGNAIAGVTLAFSQPFRVGDVVTCRNETGTVEDVTLVFTFIRTSDNRRLVIPNDVLSTEILYNHSIGDPRIVSTVQFHLGYQADLTAALSTLSAAAASCPYALKEPAPGAAVGATGPAAVRIDVSVWAENQSKAWALQADLRQRGLAALARLDALPKQLPMPS